MDNLRKIETLFEQARLVNMPVFHVSDQVLAEIAARQSIQLRPWSIMAGISAAAAVIAVVYTVNTWMSMTWSLADIYDPTILDVLL
ncbi:MAG: hypothetical protein K9N55_13650 [Phycisphaerae bacterium]|nr:hypothetical protein [Phycisphaerae bacterium]